MVLDVLSKVFLENKNCIFFLFEKFLAKIYINLLLIMFNLLNYLLKICLKNTFFN